jgi:membrane-bound lytic murein transglycosylase B
MLSDWIGPKRWRTPCALLLMVAMICALAGVMSASTVDPAFEPLVRRLVADGFAESKLRRLFPGPSWSFPARPWPTNDRALHAQVRLRWCPISRPGCSNWAGSGPGGRPPRPGHQVVHQGLPGGRGPAPGSGSERSLAGRAYPESPARPADLKLPEFPSPRCTRSCFPRNGCRGPGVLYANQAALARVRARYGLPRNTWWR